MVEALVDAALRYITRICGSSTPHGGDVNADAGRLLPVFPELVEMWIQRGTSGISCPFEVLFPLAGDDARRELMREGCSVNFLAGVVVAEAFLLSLCLKVQDVPRADLITWAVASIQGFNNKQFLGVLLNMLANPPLPVHPSLSADDEILVRDVLYDALILLDYSVLSGAEVHRADSSLFPIFVSRLAVTFDAISDARHKGDHERAESYINAFSTSNIPSYLTKWASLQAGTDHLYKPIDVTPQAFMNLEDKGLKVFGEKCSRIRKRLMQDEGQNDNLSMISRSDDDFFFIDKQSHQEGMDTKGGTDETGSNCIKECIQSIAQCFPFHDSQ
uniref:Uncharacterized protein n=1 Tax=Avena sativa TaxID=4498 RepID=A0ACD5YV54_AVESA